MGSTVSPQWDHIRVERHPEFYTLDEAGEMTVPRDDRGNLTDWTDVVEIDYSNPALRRAMIAEMRYWLEEFEIDGMRRRRGRPYVPR